MSYKKIKLFPAIVALVILLYSCGNYTHEITPVHENPGTSTHITDTNAGLSAVRQTEPPMPDIPARQIDELLQVVFFDVGQGDCILVMCGDYAMLIDAGNVGQDSLILGYLDEYGVTALEYSITTHPHSDHIGSMAEVILAMDSIGMLLMPDVVHTTTAFEHLLDAVEKRGIGVTVPEPGDTFKMGEAVIQVLAPNSSSYADLNDYSIVLRIEHGQTSFLFTGDAQDISESEQLMSGYNLSADVLKVGHHGSHTSTTQKYLDAVSPSYAVISCGTNNSYGHPRDEVTTRLNNAGTAIYRTDENGTVSFFSDGETVTVSTERDYVAKTPDTVSSSGTAAYIGNRNSHIFHLPICTALPAEKNKVYFSAREDATDNQYRPCKKCNP